MEARVAVLTATYRRATQLRRLRLHLERQTLRPAAWFVADNGAQEEIAAEIRGTAHFPAVYLALPSNRGCGAGLRAAEERALQDQGGAYTHFLILDDDAVPPDDLIERLVAVAAATGAVLAAPLIQNPDGSIWAHPEPLDKGLRKVIRNCATPEAARARLGTAPLEMTWCTGVCQFYARRVLERGGLHRDDFWMLGEDLEFSMRSTRSGKCVFVTDLVVEHLPPPAVLGPDADVVHASKFTALLQNLTYLGLRSGAGHHMASYLSGNYRRFFQIFGFSLATLRLAAACFWNGAVLAEPAGGTRGAAIRARLPGLSLRDREAS